MMIQVDVNELLSFMCPHVLSFTTTQKGQWIDFVKKSVWILRTEEMMRRIHLQMMSGTESRSLRRWCGTSKMSLASVTSVGNASENRQCCRSGVSEAD